VYQTINLNKYFNSKGITSINNSSIGNLDEFASFSFPNHFFDETIYYNDVPFNISLSEGNDNISFENDLIIEIPKNFYTDLYMLGISNNGNFSNKVELLCEEKPIVKLNINMTDLMEDEPFKSNIRFKEIPYIHSPKGKVDIKTNLWVERIQFEDPVLVDCMEFTSNPFIHIFSITLGVYDEKGRKL
jgi:hypothetical protein